MDFVLFVKITYNSGVVGNNFAHSLSTSLHWMKKFLFLRNFISQKNEFSFNRIWITVQIHSGMIILSDVNKYIALQLYPFIIPLIWVELINAVTRLSFGFIFAMLLCRCNNEWYNRIGLSIRFIPWGVPLTNYDNRPISLNNIGWMQPLISADLIY